MEHKPTWPWSCTFMLNLAIQVFAYQKFLPINFFFLRTFYVSDKGQTHSTHSPVLCLIRTNNRSLTTRETIISKNQCLLNLINVMQDLQMPRPRVIITITCFSTAARKQCRLEYKHAIIFHAVLNSLSVMLKWQSPRMSPMHSKATTIVITEICVYKERLIFWYPLIEKITKEITGKCWREFPTWNFSNILVSVI